MAVPVAPRILRFGSFRCWMTLTKFSSSIPRGTDRRVIKLGQNALKMRFRRAVAAAGLEDLTFHDLRHVGTSRLTKIYKDPLTLKLVTEHKDLKEPRAIFPQKARRSFWRRRNWNWRPSAFSCWPHRLQWPDTQVRRLVRSGGLPVLLPSRRCSALVGRPRRRGGELVDSMALVSTLDCLGGGRTYDLPGCFRPSSQATMSAVQYQAFRPIN